MGELIYVLELSIQIPANKKKANWWLLLLKFYKIMADINFGLCLNYRQ